MTDEEPVHWQRVRDVMYGLLRTGWHKGERWEPVEGTEGVYRCGSSVFYEPTREFGVACQTCGAVHFPTNAFTSCGTCHSHYMKRPQIATAFNTDEMYEEPTIDTKSINPLWKKSIIIFSTILMIYFGLVGMIYTWLTVLK